MLKKIDGTSQHDGHTHKEDVNDTDVLIAKIKEHPKLFRALTTADEIKIKRLKGNQRSAYIFCELVTQDTQSSVEWIRRPLEERQVKIAKSRIEKYLSNKKIDSDKRNIALAKIQDRLTYLQEWTHQPIIVDKKTRDHEDRRRWRDQMQTIFDVFDEQEGYSGPFTQFYESNLVRTNELANARSAIEALGLIFTSIGIDSKFKSISTELKNKIREIDQTKDEREKIKKQKATIQNMLVIIRHIFNIIGTDNM